MPAQPEFQKKPRMPKSSMGIAGDISVCDATNVPFRACVACTIDGHLPVPHPSTSTKRESSVIGQELGLYF